MPCISLATRWRGEKWRSLEFFPYCEAFLTAPHSFSSGIALGWGLPPEHHQVSFLPQFFVDLGLEEYWSKKVRKAAFSPASPIHSEGSSSSPTLDSCFSYRKLEGVKIQIICSLCVSRLSFHYNLPSHPGQKREGKNDPLYEICLDGHQTKPISLIQVLHCDHYL